MNDMQRERVIWGALIWAGVVLLLDWLLARVSGLHAPRALVVLALLTVIQSALVALRLRLRRLADDERRAAELAAREGTTAGLFAAAAEEDAADEPFSAE
ncbi:MAG: hypothetical protein K9N49_09355, partial [Candidatus Marinimicrobia bacterium]|nr:hypothetical protein [Candidatus Neomarinimicrobiota bacterium]